MSMARWRDGLIDSLVLNKILVHVRTRTGSSTEYGKRERNCDVDWRKASSKLEVHPQTTAQYKYSWCNNKLLYQLLSSSFFPSCD